ncbi:hypothetical protein INT47_009188 [Mucor saturninus]|uniref:Uncharacterized protein n=1 Tax=Mucor saturninus TaxID=64648 RepID=A0A8H7RM59_9FUNG|nr:hypothetical protein INT47_009188 [Mucor saturninus]
MDQEIKDSQHPLALNSANEPLIGDEIVKKSVNSRKRRRGSCRHLSGNSDANETTSDTENHTQRRQTSQMEEDKDSPAFQSLVDIIHEMKRLPSISISPEKQPTSPESSNSCKRVRRHSEPQHKYKQQQHHHHNFKNPLSTVNEQQHSKHADMTQGKPVFSNSFLALKLDDEGDNNIDTLVSPLNEQQQRTRSKSVPDAIVPQRRDSLSSTRKVLYPAHLPLEEASVEIRAHALFSGILRVDLKDRSEANVECEDLDGASIYIFGSRNRNRAFDGDGVAVRLVPVDEMMAEKISKRQRHTRRLSLNSVDTPSNVVCNPGLSSIPENDKNVLDMNISSDSEEDNVDLDFVTVPTISKMKNTPPITDENVTTRSYSPAIVHARKSMDRPQDKIDKNAWIIDKLGLEPFALTCLNRNGVTIEYNALCHRSNLENIIGENFECKSVLPEKRKYDSVIIDTIVCPNLAPLIHRSPYRNMLMKLHHFNLNGDVLAGAILLNTISGEAILLNTIEVYGCTKNVDIHREISTPEDSTIPPSSSLYPNVWSCVKSTRDGRKLIIGTQSCSALVTSSLRLDCERDPDVGPYKIPRIILLNWTSATTSIAFSPAINVLSLSGIEPTSLDTSMSAMYNIHIL